MSESTIDKVNKGLKRRYRNEMLFKSAGIFSVLFGLLCLLILFSDSIYKGHTAFFQYEILLTINFDADELEIDDINNESQINGANYGYLVKEALRQQFPDASGRSQKKRLYSLVSSGAVYELQDMVEKDPSLLGKTKDLWFIADDDVDTYLKLFVGHESEFGRIKEDQIEWLNTLKIQGKLKSTFNTTFFSVGDSREPEQAGILGALMGSFYLFIVTLALSFPIAISTAIYLEEFAPKNKWTGFIEVNINNLAAVPSIIFGLLGLAIFISFFGVPRSTPLVGGLVLALMTLPTIIISSRAAIKSVPPSIREAALGIGASKMQMVMHHVLPLAMPGMLTGTIIGMARALGETAPLLMIGMVAFIVDVPSSSMDPATALPVQIYLWSDSPERAFTAKTSAAILVLLAFLIMMNGSAVYLRKRLEKRW
jgi:phosphate transport system permease protein